MSVLLSTFLFITHMITDTRKQSHIEINVIQAALYITNRKIWMTKAHIEAKLPEKALERFCNLLVSYHFHECIKFQKTVHYFFSTTTL